MLAINRYNEIDGASINYANLLHRVLINQGAGNLGIRDWDLYCPQSSTHWLQYGEVMIIKSSLKRIK